MFCNPFQYQFQELSALDAWLHFASLAESVYNHSVYAIVPDHHLQTTANLCGNSGFSNLRKTGLCHHLQAAILNQQQLHLDDQCRTSFYGLQILKEASQGKKTCIFTYQKEEFIHSPKHNKLVWSTCKNMLLIYRTQVQRKRQLWAYQNISTK